MGRDSQPITHGFPTGEGGGSDFLGYHYFSAQGRRVSSATRVRFLQRAARLYEQEPGSLAAPLGSGLALGAGWGVLVADAGR